ncbi:hypothetical protein C8A05DRAFT_45252 [Staphylotrichum tortipilum]|uniref:Uncharacterized protein n=1 Tax=Staphylotrichum tortipilum TaxID=2831512 RepID=A0AAN6RS63_9PEZI|nr:hypothetical protein C8A05DRAFT_45252 [Staphylotrichum longicolle]
MARLPPAEKLSLALRKNVRDEFDNNKEDLAKQLSEITGATWTIDINPLAIWPYHNDGYAKESLGSCIKAYVDGAIYQIKYLSGRLGSTFTTELNNIAHANVLTLDVEETTPPRFSYGGCDILDGKLRILFSPGNLGTNIDNCCDESTLTKALNAAPQGDAPMAFVVRLGINNDYDPKISEVRSQIAELLGKSADAITLSPNFEANFAALSAAAQVKGTSLRDDWQSTLADFTLKYFEALAYQMKYIKVGEDEMIQEGVLEAVSTNEYAFRIVEKLKYDSYCEVDIEDGVLYLQCTAENYGTNIDYVASKLMDRL